MTITIVAVLSATTVVGFSYLGDILRAREVVTIMKDIVKQEELKVLRGDFDKAVIHYLPTYLVVEEQFDDATIGFNFISSPSCGANPPAPDFQDGTSVQYVDPANLTKYDREEEVLEIRSVTPDTECIDFNKDTPGAHDLEWAYQLSEGESFSNRIRFIHFNAKRDNLNPLWISQGAGARIEISAPYAKKEVFEAGGNLQASVILKIEDQQATTAENLTLQ